MTSRMLVTGGASFIGSYLVEHLVEQGNEVSVIDDLSSGHEAFLSSVRPTIEFYKMNIKDNPSKLYNIMKGTDIVFHLANAHGGRAWIHNHPAQCCTNMAVDNLAIEAAVKAGVKHFQYCSSACVYPLSYQKAESWEPLHEDMVDYDNLTSADEEYGLAKLMGEVSLRAHQREFGLNGSIVRLSSIYGPRENETHAVVALIAKAFVRQDPYEIYGSGNQIRNFTFVRDVIECMALASTNVRDCTPINLGTMEYVSINELVEMIFKKIQWRPKAIFHDKSKPEGANSRVVDNHRATDLLGFKKWTMIYKGIEETINWYTSTHSQEQVANNLNALLNERTFKPQIHLTTQKL